MIVIHQISYDRVYLLIQCRKRTVHVHQNIKAIRPVKFKFDEFNKERSDAYDCFLLILSLRL